MENNWTMIKHVGAREMNGALLLKEEELKLKENLFKWWPKRRVENAIKNIGNGSKITLFDVNGDGPKIKTMRRISSEDFTIEWDIKDRNYMVGDEILMRWDPEKKWLCYMVVRSRALRMNADMPDASSRTSSPVNLSGPLFFENLDSDMIFKYPTYY